MRPYRLLMLHKYGLRAASFRYRFQQFIPAFASNGIDCTVSSLLEDDYLAARLTVGSLRWTAVLRAYFRRIAALANAGDFDALMIGLELLPFVPAWLERYLAFRKLPYIFDYDDAVFHAYDRHRLSAVRWLLGHKFDTVIRNACLVVAGSTYLYEYAAARSKNVFLIPTAVDLQAYPAPKRATHGAPFTIGWIGSPSGQRCLQMLTPVFRRFRSTHPDSRIIFVGSGAIDMDGIAVELRPWAEHSETQDLLDFDVGIMPLPDDPWMRGKCAFKLIQYMACGLPVIASPVGENVRVVSKDVGFLAEGEDAWLEALEVLYRDAALRQQLGSRGRELVASTYSLQVTAPTLVTEVRRALNAHGQTLR